VHLSLELERLKYEDMITAYIDETLEAVHIALKGAGLAATDIQEILLVGGATRTPLIRRRLERELGMQSRSELDPDLCVTTGAAIQAATISGQQVSGVLVDVTPYTFGTSAWSDRNGEPYPYTLHPPDPQKHTDSRHQKRGLRDHAPRSADDRGADLPRRGPGRPQQYQDRLLPDRGPERCPRRQHHRDHLCAGCKRHPQRHLPREAHGAEEAGRRPPERRETVQAQALIEQAERLMESANAEDKEDLVNLVESVRDTLAGDDAEATEQAVAELSDLIYYLES